MEAGAWRVRGLLPARWSFPRPSGWDCWALDGQGQAEGRPDNIDQWRTWTQQDPGHHALLNQASPHGHCQRLLLTHQ